MPEALAALGLCLRSLVLGDEAGALLGHGTGYFVVRAVAWSAVIVAVCCPIAVARFRRG